MKIYNKYKFYRRIATLASLGLLSTSFLTSCSNLMDRTVDPSVLKETFSYAPDTWNSVKSFTSQELDQIQKLEDTLLYSDPFSQYQGGIAADKQDGGWSFPDGTFDMKINLRHGGGGANSDNKAQVQWFKYDGSVATAADVDPTGSNPSVTDGRILPSHVLNALKWALNPYNAAEGIMAWECVHAEAVGEIEGILADFYEEDEDSEITPSEYAAVIDQWANGEKEFDLADKYHFETVYSGHDVIEVNKDGADIVLHFERQPESFAESLLAASAFSPLPDVALVYDNPTYNYAGVNYGDPQYVKKMLLSGAYKADADTDLNASGSGAVRKFVANPNYYRYDSVTIKTIIQYSSDGWSVSESTDKFVSGELSGTSLTPTDEANWNKYVGEDKTNPKFEGAQYRDIIQLGSWGLTTNFKHSVVKDNNYGFVGFTSGDEIYSSKGESSTIVDKVEVSADNEKNNLGLALPSVRSLLAFVLNRNYYAHLRAGALDDDNFNPETDESACLRNNYTPKGLASFEGKDYVEYVTDQYAVDAAASTADDDASLLLGKDADDWADAATGDEVEGYRHNPYVGLAAFEETANVSEESSYLGKVSELREAYLEAAEENGTNAVSNMLVALKKKVYLDLEQIGYGDNSNNQINIYLLLNGGFSASQAQAFKDLINNFNIEIGALNSDGNSWNTNNKDTGAGSPIALIPYTSSAESSSNYTQCRNQGWFSLIISGWSPDYADPYNFLQIFCTDGYIGNYYMHSNQVLNTNVDLKTQDVTPLDSTPFNGGSTENYQKAYAPLAEAFSTYNQAIYTAAAIVGDQNAQYEQYAVAEAAFNHNSPVTEALYVDPTKGISMSYVDNTTLSYAADQTSSSSTSFGRAANAKLRSKLLNHEEYRKIQLYHEYAKRWSTSSSGADAAAYAAALQAKWATDGSWGDAPTLAECETYRQENEDKTANWLY